MFSTAKSQSVKTAIMIIIIAFQVDIANLCILTELLKVILFAKSYSVKWIHPLGSIQLSDLDRESLVYIHKVNTGKIFNIVLKLLCLPLLISNS